MKPMRNLLIAATMMLTMSAYAFIEDRPAGAEFHGEQNQQQVSEQQQLNGTFDVVGEENLRGDNLGADGPMREQSAADVLSQKSQRGAEVLKQVEAEKKSGTPWWMYLLGALGVSCVVGGSFFALKKYTDKNAPPPPSEKSTITW